MSSRIALIMLLLFICKWSAQPAAAVPITGAGPGGFEQLGGGPSALRLWFAGENIDGTNNSTLTAGGAVATWVNLAIPGSHNAVVGPNNAPVYQPAPALNGNPRVYFDGTADRELVTNFNVSLTDSYHVFVVADRAPIADPTLGSCCNAIVSAGSGAHRNNVLFLDNPQSGGEGGPNAIRYHAHGSASVAGNLSTGFNNGNSHILDQRYQFSNNTLTGHFDGVSPGTINPPGGAGVAGGAFRIGGEENLNARNHLGTISEVIHFNRSLNSAERIVVENYLSSKYALPIAGAVDHYAGDTGIDYDRGVFGVGDDGASEVTNAGTAGFGIEVTDGSLGTNEWVFAGHDIVTNSIIGLEGIDPNAHGERWSRVWYVDKTVTDGVNATVAFDFEDSGLTTPLPSTSSHLLYSSDSDFSDGWDILDGTLNITDGTVSFNLLNASLLDGFYTLGINISVPEPNSLLLMLGVLGCGMMRRKRSQTTAKLD